MFYNFLPAELWFIIFQIEHNQKFRKVINEIKNRVCYIEIDKNNNAFIICEPNYFSPLLEIAVF